MGKTNYKSIRLFKSDFWEYFSHINPITPSFWTPICILLFNKIPSLIRLSFMKMGMGLRALLVWSLTEYTMHRFVFHFEAKRSRLVTAYLPFSWDPSR